MNRLYDCIVVGVDRGLIVIGMRVLIKAMVTRLSRTDANGCASSTYKSATSTFSKLSGRGTRPRTNAYFGLCSRDFRDACLPAGAALALPLDSAFRAAHFLPDEALSEMAMAYARKLLASSKVKVCILLTRARVFVRTCPG